MYAVDRADLHAGGVLYTYTGLDNDISHVPEGYHAPYMPESEPKPRALEAVTPGSGQGWKAVIKNGKQVVVHEIPVAPAAAAAAAQRIQRLSEHPHPSLSPVYAWGTEDGGLWVAVEPNEGTPLSSVLARGRFTPHAAAALGISVLSGIAALHEAGIAMGGFDATAVRLTSNGDVRLAGHPVAAVRGAPSQGDLRADVRSCGMAICAAFGVDPAGAPAPSELPPGLVVTMRSMASGAMGPAVDRAQGALREMAGPLLAPDRQMAAQSELALRAGGREMPSITPFIPQAEAAAPAAPPPPPVQEAPPPRPASYEPPPRPVDTYSSLPIERPQETYSPPAAYQTATPAAPVEPEAPAQPAEPVTWEPTAAPLPEAAESAPAAPPEPAPVEPPPPITPAFENTPPAIPTWEPAPMPSTPPEPAPAAGAFAEAAASPPMESKPSPTWSPVQTSEWTPGQSHIAASEWTGEVTPAPARVPDEFRSTRSSTSPPPIAAAAVTTAAPPIPRAQAPAPVRKPAARRPSMDFPSERPRWLIPAAAAVALLLLIGGGGVYLASRGGASTSSRPTTSPHPSPSTAKASPTPTAGLRQVPVYAPGAAAPITGVAFLPPPDTNCQLGGPCKVTVEIKFSSAQRTNVAYTVNFFDRCTGVTTAVGGGHFTPPGFIRVDITSQLSLPSGAKTGALVAVTSTPAAAETTTPLILGPDTC